ncbi:MAG: stalk domain-containing protein [Bacillota bacterium]
MLLKRILLALLLISITLAPATVTRAGEATIRHIYIAGRQYPGSYGELAGYYATLQVRSVLEALGHSAMVWSPEDGSTTIYGLPESPVVIRPGDRIVQLKGRSLTLSIAPYIKNAKLYAPLDFFQQVLHARVEWVTATWEVEITPPPYNQAGGFGPVDADPATFSALGRDGAGRLYLVVATGPKQGLWRSTDHGRTWEEAGQGLTGPATDARLVAAPGETAYLLHAGALWSRPPGAAAWTRVATPDVPDATVIAAAAQEGGLLWVALDRAPSDGQALAYDLYHLDPATGQWQESDLDLAIAGLTTDPAGRLWAYGKWGAAVLTQGAWAPVHWQPTFRVFQIAVRPDDPQWVWALTTEGLRVSQDGGQTWQFSHLPFPADPAHYATFKLLPGVGQEVFLLTGEQGVLYSPTGGGQWYRVTGYWPDARVLDAVMDGERLLLASTGGGVVIPVRIPQPGARPLPRLAPRYIDWGPNLAAEARGAGSLWLDPQQADTAFALITRGEQGEMALLKTTDGGKSWAPLPLPAEPVADEFGRVRTPYLIHHPSRSGHYGLVYADSIQITTDGGATWSAIPAQSRPMNLPTHLTFLESGRLIGSWESRAGSRIIYSDDYKALNHVDGGPGWHIGTLVVNPAVPDRVYACDWDTRHPCQTSADGGLTWQPLAAQPPGVPPQKLHWSPAAPAELFAGRYVSRDGGKSWEPLPYFQEGDKLIHIAIHPKNPQQRAVVTEVATGGRHLLLSRDGGQTWSSVGQPPNSTWIHAIQFDAKGRLWVGADTGIWKLQNF